MKCADWIADVSDDVQLIEHLLYQGLTIAEQSVSPILTTAIKREYSVFTEGTLPFQ
jgi:hypothetical protein